MGAPSTRPMQNSMIILFPLTFQMVEAAKIFEDIKGVFATVNRIETNSGHMTHLNRAQKYAHEHAKWGNLQAELISTSKNSADTFTSTTFGGNYRYPKLNEKSESRPLIVRHPVDELQSTASPYKKVLVNGMEAATKYSCKSRDRW